MGCLLHHLLQNPAQQVRAMYSLPKHWIRSFSSLVSKTGSRNVLSSSFEHRSEVQVVYSAALSVHLEQTVQVHEVLVDTADVLVDYAVCSATADNKETLAASSLGNLVASIRALASRDDYRTEAVSILVHIVLGRVVDHSSHDRGIVAADCNRSSRPGDGRRDHTSRRRRLHDSGGPRDDVTFPDSRDSLGVLAQCKIDRRVYHEGLHVDLSVAVSG